MIGALAAICLPVGMLLIGYGVGRWHAGKPWRVLHLRNIVHTFANEMRLEGYTTLARQMEKEADNVLAR